MVMRRVVVSCVTPGQVSARAYFVGMTSTRVPRGMTGLSLRTSEEAVEELAEAYVSMDMHTLTEFQRLATAKMAAATASGTKTGINFEDALLQGMGGGGGGVMSATAVPAGAAAAAASATEAPSEAGDKASPAAGKKAAEKLAFDVSIKKYPAENKVKLIKELRTVCGLSIADAKAAIEKCPGVVAANVPKADAEKLADLMKKHGAEVQIL